MSKYKIDIVIDEKTRDIEINLSDNVTISEIGYTMIFLFDYLDDEHREIMLSDLGKIKDDGVRFSNSTGDSTVDEILDDMKELKNQGLDLSQHITQDDYDDPEKMRSIIEKLKKQ